MGRSAYHVNALSRLSVDYEPDADRTRALLERARELGVNFPASFCEWYGMRDGVELLARHSNSDRPLAIAALGEPIDWAWDEPIDWAREGLLPFMVENQGVCIWAVQLDAGEDPPVLVADDRDDYEWRRHAATFSTFIECQVWDHEEVGEPGTAIQLFAQAAELRDVDLSFLRARFHERWTTHGHPGDNQYRFERGDTRLLIWDGPGQADWSITTTSEHGLADLAAELWGCANLSKSLWSNDERGKRVLGRLRTGDA